MIFVLLGDKPFVAHKIFLCPLIQFGFNASNMKFNIATAAAIVLGSSYTTGVYAKEAAMEEIVSKQSPRAIIWNSYSSHI